MGTQQPTNLNTDTEGRATSAQFADAGDGTTRWHHHQRVDDGGNVALGATDDVKAADGSADATAIALLKAILDGQASAGVGPIGVVFTDAAASGAIACDTLYGWSIRNTSVTDGEQAVIYVRLGNTDAATPVLPVALAPSETATLVFENGLDIGASGIYWDIEADPATGAIVGVVITD